MAEGGDFKRKAAGPILVAVGLFIAYTGYQHGNVSARLKGEGVVVTGRVVGHETARSGRRSRKYLLVTQYTTKDGARDVEKNLEVPRTRFDQTPDGSAVEVRYLPSDPEVAEVEGAGNNGAFEQVIGGVMALVGMLVSIVTFRKRARPTVGSPS
jgi:hypothetical protein